MRVDFYHLTATPLERALPAIAEKVVAGGARLLIVAGERQLAALDEHLWSYAPDSFLPHGRVSGEGASAQPILLSTDLDPRNGASCVAITDGLWRHEALAFTRTFYFFDNGQLDTARGAWRTLKSDPAVHLHYWKQVDGRWLEGP